MLVWHIDRDLELWHSNKANADAAHQRIDIVEADRVQTNNSYGGDPFPGTGRVTTYDFMSWARENIFSFDLVEETAKELDLIIIMMTPKMRTLSFLAFTYSQDGLNQMADAISVITLLFIVVCYVVAGRFGADLSKSW